MKTLLRIKSHRARDKFNRLNIPHVEKYTFNDGYFTEIDEKHAETCLSIKGISRARKPKYELLKCW